MNEQAGSASGGGGGHEAGPETGPHAGSGGRGARVLLSAMMFLQFFVWGAWFVTLGPFMDQNGLPATAIGNAYTTAPIAAILAPLFLGVIADRFFPSQVVLGVLHVLGGVLLLAAPALVPEASGASAWPFVTLLLLHMLCYMPTLGLSNTVAFNALSRPDKEFPLVRVWGTVGWIVAGFAVAAAMGAAASAPAGASDEAAEAARAASPVFFYVAGAVGVLLGLFSFVLPHTPAPMRGQPVSVGAALGLDALKLMKDRAFAVFILGSLLICIPLAAYYQQAAAFATDAGMERVPVMMTFGQMSEVLFMLVMPLAFARLGVKWMLTIGMLAWVARYGLFAAAWDASGVQHMMPLILAGIILHGVCYDFFFVTGQIYTEQKAPKRIRAQAQSFLVLVTQGLGMLIGNQLFARYVAANTAEGEDPAWRTVWLAPCLFAGVVMVVFFVLFNERGGRPERRGLEAAPVEPTPAPA